MKKKRNQDTIEIQAFLDESIVRNFREAINSSRIFNNSDKHKHRYTEQAELKKQIVNIQEQLARLDEMKTSKDNFIKAVRRFMEMQTLTPAILHELIDRIEVHHVVGVGKSRLQQIIIHYRFVGCVEIPDAPQATHTQDTRQGVSVTYEAIAG